MFNNLRAIKTVVVHSTIFFIWELNFLSLIQYIATVIFNSWFFSEIFFGSTAPLLMFSRYFCQMMGESAMFAMTVVKWTLRAAILYWNTNNRGYLDFFVFCYDALLMSRIFISKYSCSRTPCCLSSTPDNITVIGWQILNYSTCSAWVLYFPFPWS